jgi:RNA polymerase sigma factor (TIGR02999 family)
VNHRPEPRELTSQILREGDRDGRAFDRLAPIVYTELRDIARAQMRREQGGHALQTTALVHEAYLRLVDQSAIGTSGRGYFFAAAARAMRQVLIEHARARRAHKRGGAMDRVSFVPEVAVAKGTDVDVLALEEALTDLAALDPRQARVVELRFYGGLSVLEVAELLGVSDRTIKTDWQVARAWLRRRLDHDDGDRR